MTFNHIVLIRLQAKDAAEILREAIRFGYRATVLSYATSDQVVWMQFMANEGISFASATKSRWWSRIRTEREPMLEDVFYHYY